MTSPMVRPRVLTGREAAMGGRALQTVAEKRGAWPYPWESAPPGAKRVEEEGNIEAPAVGTQTVVLAYTVPLGYRFWLTGIAQFYSGTGFIPGRGDIVWRLDKNSPIGVSNLNALPIQGYAALKVPRGSYVIPWRLPMPECLEPNDCLRSKVTTGAAISEGDPNWFTSMFLGWLVQAE